jgi:hypothetical protein
MHKMLMISELKGGFYLSRFAWSSKVYGSSRPGKPAILSMARRSREITVRTMAQLESLRAKRGSVTARLPAGNDFGKFGHKSDQDSLL